MSGGETVNSYNAGQSKESAMTYGVLPKGRAREKGWGKDRRIKQKQKTLGQEW